MNKNMNTHPFDDDKLHEECGVFGIHGHGEASALTALGLHALQHRGQEASGIVTFDGEDFYAHRALGLVDDTFGDADVIEKLKGNIAIGHNRYSTTGGTFLRNVQPFFADLSFGGFAVAHNGNLTNAQSLRQQLVNDGSLFQSTSDTEVILHLMALSKKESLVDKLISSLAIKFTVRFRSSPAAGGCAVRRARRAGHSAAGDGQTGRCHGAGVRNLRIRHHRRGICARRQSRGRLVVIDDKGVHSYQCRSTNHGKPFLHFRVYLFFARPDSQLAGKSVYDMRKNIGAVARASESPCDTGRTSIVPVPDSGVPAAIGYAQASGKPFELGIIRNHYVGRTFIEPTDRIRHLGVKLKHNANRTHAGRKKRRAGG
jgi:amidophosphoribosyltransferase